MPDNKLLLLLLLSDARRVRKGPLDLTGRSIRPMIFGDNHKVEIPNPVSKEIRRQVRPHSGLVRASSPPGTGGDLTGSKFMVSSFRACYSYRVRARAYSAEALERSFRVYY